MYLCPILNFTKTSSKTIRLEDLPSNGCFSRKIAQLFKKNTMKNFLNAQGVDFIFPTTLSVILSFFQTSSETNCPEDLPSDGCVSRKILFLFLKTSWRNNYLWTLQKLVSELLERRLLKKIYLLTNFLFTFPFPLFLINIYISILQKAWKISWQCLQKPEKNWK